MTRPTLVASSEAAHKIHSVVIYRLDEEHLLNGVLIAKHDATTDKLNKYFGSIIAKMIQEEPPQKKSRRLGGFKAVECTTHQIVYGVDANGMCFAVAAGFLYSQAKAIRFLLDLYERVMTTTMGPLLRSATTESLSIGPLVSDLMVQQQCDSDADSADDDSQSTVLEDDDDEEEPPSRMIYGWTIKTSPVYHDEQQQYVDEKIPASLPPPPASSSSTSSWWWKKRCMRYIPVVNLVGAAVAARRRRGSEKHEEYKDDEEDYAMDGDDKTEPDLKFVEW